MSGLFLKLVNMATAAGWLVLAVIAVRLVFKKAPKWLLCALWAVVAVRLVCPVMPESAVSLLPSAQVISSDILTGDTFDVTTGVDAVDAPLNDYLGDHYAEGVSVPVDAGTDFMTAAGWVWLSGGTALVVCGLVSYLRLRRRVRASAPLRDNIFLCDDIDTPFILGVIMPRIYLPSGMDTNAMACVLRHEAAHLRRRDHWWKVLGYGLLAVYWFHPLVWLGYTLFCRDMESACDESVIRTMDREGRIAYSRALLACSLPVRRVAVCPLAFGETGVKGRIRAVLDYRKPSFRLMAATVVVCLAVAVCFLTNPLPADTAHTPLVSVSESYTLGRYEQDGDVSNGAEPIQWQVLDCQGTEVLLLSRRCLDVQCWQTPRDDGSYEATWETCSLRAWLRDEFLPAAFTDTERTQLRSTSLENRDNTYFGYVMDKTGAALFMSREEAESLYPDAPFTISTVEGGGDTRDTVFTLSIEEMAYYFGDGQLPGAAAPLTAYAQSRSAAPGNYGWWLRSIGSSPAYAACVSPAGQVYCGGQRSYGDFVMAVRPAVWIDLSA